MSRCDARHHALAQRIQSATPARMTIVCQTTVCELSKKLGK
jgi:hypothetical protein